MTPSDIVPFTTPRSANLPLLTCCFILAAICFAGGNILSGTTAGLIAAGVVLVPALVLYSTIAPRWWIFSVLAAKPIIDLGWRIQFSEFGAQRVNIPALVAIVVLAFCGLAYMAHSRSVLKFKPVVLLGLAAGLSVLMTPTVDGLNQLLRLYSALGMCAVAPLALRDSRDLEILGRCLLVTVSVPVVLSFLQLAGVLPYLNLDQTEFGELSRVSGTYDHPTVLIFHLVIAIPLALFVIYRNGHRLWVRMAGWLFIAAALLALVFTYHRVGILAAALEIILWFMLTGQHKKALLTCVVIAIGALAVSDWVSMLYKGVGDLGNGIDSNSLRGRGANWFVFLSAYANGHPLNWLLGFGGPEATGDVPGVGLYTSSEPHTDVVRMLYVYGIAGLALYGWIVAAFLKRALTLYRSRMEPYRTLGAIAIPILVAILLLSVTAEPSRYPTPAWFIFAVGAMVVTKERQYRKSLTAGTPEVT